ncbi:hypothetical protein K6U39_23420, partial [Vibrio parahaemolyticus]|nr:hypothetical protein [Vibrio parahaemolyticus]
MPPPPPPPPPPPHDLQLRPELITILPPSYNTDIIEFRFPVKLSVPLTNKIDSPEILKIPFCIGKNPAQLSYVLYNTFGTLVEPEDKAPIQIL